MNPTRRPTSDMPTPSLRTPAVPMTPVRVDSNSASDTAAAESCPLPPQPCPRPNGSYVIHHPDHIEVHAAEGTYRRQHHDQVWWFQPFQFPTERVRVRTHETLAWLQAEAEFFTRRWQQEQAR